MGPQLEWTTHCLELDAERGRRTKRIYRAAQLRAEVDT
jgi:hypothetical protein